MLAAANCALREISLVAIPRPMCVAAASTALCSSTADAMGKFGAFCVLPMTVRIRCSFSHYFRNYSKQLGAGTVKIENIAPNAIVYKTMKMASKISPTISATCHIVSLKRIGYLPYCDVRPPIQ